MSRVCLGAYTAPGVTYPEYVSINTVEGGLIEITVRSPTKRDGSCGDTSAMMMSRAEFMRMLDGAESKLLGNA